MSSFEESEVDGVTSEPTTPPPNSSAPVLPSLSNEAWGQVARTVVLFTLLGMALAAAARLGFGNNWAFEFLKRNKIEMHDRSLLMIQMVSCGLTLAVSALALMLLAKTHKRCTPERMEQWAWFLSPLILLPAPVVILQHNLWNEHHNELLPIVLFGGILAEFFFSKSLSHVPSSVQRFFKWIDETETSVAKAAVIESTSGTRVDGTETAPAAASSTAPAKSKWKRTLAWCDANTALLIVIVAALAYGAFMSFFTVRWHRQLGTAIFDLGINNNLLYGGLSGHINESTIIFPDEPAKYLANHVKWGIYGFLPLYALFPRAETLLIIQSVSLGLGAIPLFLFCKKRVPASWAAAIALCYLSYYPLHGANFYEMKLVTTVAAVVLTCVWAIDDKRYWLGGIAFAWALVMREDIPVPLVVVGGVFLLSGRRPLAGLIMATIATTWFIFLRFRFMNDVGSWWFPNMYKDLWAEPERGFQGVVKTLFSNPAFTLKHIFVEKKFWYLMHLLVPLVFLPMRRWYGWAALVPGAILTLLVTDYAPPLMFSFQYVMHWAPYLFLASAIVLGSMRKAQGGPVRAQAALIAMCLTTAGLSYNYGAFAMREDSFKSGYNRISFDFDEFEQERYRDLVALLKTIEKDASVGATEHVGAHLSSRVKFYTLRRDTHDVTYMVARKKELSLDKTRRTIYQALESGKYGVHGRFGEFVVLKKGHAITDNAALIEEWNLDKESAAQKRRHRRANARKKADLVNEHDTASAKKSAAKLDPESEPDEADSAQEDAESEGSENPAE